MDVQTPFSITKLVECCVRIPIALALSAGLSQLPAEPDFSGRWVIDSPVPAPADAVVTLTVTQPVTRTNIRGEPIGPAYLTITIRRERASGITDETRSIGTIGGTVGAVVGSQKRPSVTSHVETVWQGASLLFLNGQSGSDGNWLERRETWSVESDGRLRVELVSEAKDQPRHTAVSFYRRD